MCGGWGYVTRVVVSQRCFRPNRKLNHANSPTMAPNQNQRTKHRPEAVAHAEDIKSLRKLMEEVYELEAELQGVSKGKTLQRSGVD